MARQERKIVTYVCDRCGFEQDDDAIRQQESQNQGPSPLRFLVMAAVRDPYGNSLGDPTGKRQWLCPPCATKWGQFMEGRELAS